MKLIYSLLILLLTSCGVQWQYTTLNHAAQVDSIYRSPDVQIDTINSVYVFRWKIRRGVKFRKGNGPKTMQQPYSFYWNNPMLEGIWRPYNRFDIYLHSNWFWNDWAFNYPFHHTWGWNNWYNWNRPYYYGWNRPYRPWNSWYQGPFNNSGYNVVYNASRRGALTTNLNKNSNVRSNRLTVNRNKPRVNVNKPINIPNINNSRPRINNNSRPRINNNSRPRINNNSRPSYVPSSNIRTAPSSNSRSSNNNISRGNSRGKN